ncbi:MAG: hypothetical protein AB8E82_17660 [Aureispira sp.]
MSKNPKVSPDVQNQMGEQWNIKVSSKPFSEGKGANMPAWGYVCGGCGSEQTKIQFAESTQEEDSNLLWMELHCRACKNYTLYQRK